MGVVIGITDTFEPLEILDGLGGLAVALLGKGLLFVGKLLVETVFWTIGSKEGKERLPHPGILISQPVEISNKSINIAEKIDRPLNVSRNCSFPESVLVEFWNQFKFSIAKSQ